MILSLGGGRKFVNNLIIRDSQHDLRNEITNNQIIRKFPPPHTNKLIYAPPFSTLTTNRDA